MLSKQNKSTGGSVFNSVHCAVSGTVHGKRVNQKYGQGKWYAGDPNRDLRVLQSLNACVYMTVFVCCAVSVWEYVCVGIYGY